MPSDCCYFVDKASAAGAAPALNYFGSILHCPAVFTQNLGQTRVCFTDNSKLCEKHVRDTIISQPPRTNDGHYKNNSISSQNSRSTSLIPTKTITLSNHKTHSKDYYPKTFKEQKRYLLQNNFTCICFSCLHYVPSKKSPTCNAGYAFNKRKKTCPIFSYRKSGTISLGDNSNAQK